MNGIHSNWRRISPANNPEPDTYPVKMVIKNWRFIGNTGWPTGTPSYPSAILEIPMAGLDAAARVEGLAVLRQA